MSVLGQHTQRVSIGQGVLDAIRRGPAILAQEFLTTQHFAQGRVIFVLASGEWKNIDGWLTYTPGATLGRADAIASRLAVIRAHAERAGRDPDAIACGTLPLLLVHPDRAKVERWLDHPFMQWHALAAEPALIDAASGVL